MGDDFQLLSDPPGWVLVMDGVAQSWCDPAEPTNLQFGYMLRMADFLDSIAPRGERLRVIHVGGAAMTMARYIAARRPTSAQIVLEPNTGLTDLVRRRLPLPAHSGIKVRPVDGFTGVAALPGDYAQVVIVDAFEDARVPAELASTVFHLQLRRVLTADGLLLVNLIDSHPFWWTRRVLAGLAECFVELALCAESATLKGRRHGNLLVAAANRELPIDQVTRRSAGSVFPFRVLSGERLRAFIGAASPFTVEDAVASPAVERGLLHFD